MSSGRLLTSVAAAAAAPLQSSLLLLLLLLAAPPLLLAAPPLLLPAPAPSASVLVPAPGATDSEVVAEAPEAAPEPAPEAAPEAAAGASWANVSSTGAGGRVLAVATPVSVSARGSVSAMHRWQVGHCQRRDSTASLRRSPSV